MLMDGKNLTLEGLNHASVGEIGRRGIRMRGECRLLMDHEKGEEMLHYNSSPRLTFSNAWKEPHSWQLDVVNRGTGGGRRV